LLERSHKPDPLTGLPNRRAIEARSRRSGASAQVCVAIVDIDHFRAIERDAFGHAFFAAMR
jgi:GGDEF domain-containing protein